MSRPATIVFVLSFSPKMRKDKIRVSTMLDLSTGATFDTSPIHTVRHGWCYLASVMDLHSRKIIGHSFSRTMDTQIIIVALDNACIESFHSILKEEEVNTVQYYDFDCAKLTMFRFIEFRYNRKRIHGSIGYITPQMKEDLARAI